MLPPRCNFNRHKLPENSRMDDDLRHSINILNNLKYIEEEHRSQKLVQNNYRKPITNSNYINLNLDGIIKGNIINTFFYSTPSQVPPHFTLHLHKSLPPFTLHLLKFLHLYKFLQRSLILQQILTGYFPPHMYDPQINMITKPFELNKERPRKDFMSPKYENRRREFFATFSESLQAHIR